VSAVFTLRRPGENTASDDTFLALRDKVRRIAANIAKLLRQ